jgi:hypothetical protein
MLSDIHNGLTIYDPITCTYTLPNGVIVSSELLNYLKNNTKEYIATGKKFRQELKEEPSIKREKIHMASTISAKEMAQIQKAQKAAAEKKANGEAPATQLWPFWIPVGEERDVTFLDGDVVTEDGVELFDVPFYLQHTVQTGTTWLSFQCPKRKHGDCPACNAGVKGTYVCVFTIINHTPIISKKDPSVTYENQKQLFIATSGTREELFMRAKKFGGSLKGQLVNIGRSKKDKAPRVGDVFTFMGKRSLAELKKICGKEYNFSPANYDEDLFVYTPEQLLELGVGYKGHSNNTKPQGQKSGKVASLQQEEVVDMEEETLEW